MAHRSKFHKQAETVFLFRNYLTELSQGGSTMAATFTVTSTAFSHEAPIPARHTCDGENLSPAISWQGIPEGAQSLVVICMDPDAPTPVLPLLTFVHWVVYDIPAKTSGLPEGVPAGPVMEGGAKQGKNGWKKNAYGGPCPPLGTHRYYFRAYALDTVLGLEPAGATKKAVLKAMEGHVLAEGELMGTYKRKK
jgi:Raf kinase inhibitor-like YbhB/YbcL family protein